MVAGTTAEKVRAYLTVKNYPFEREVEEVPRDARIGTVPWPSSNNRNVTGLDPRLIHIGPAAPRHPCLIWADTSTRPVTFHFAVGLETQGNGSMKLVRRDGESLWHAPLDLGGSLTIDQDSGEVNIRGHATVRSIKASELCALERADDPNEPAEGEAVFWMANGLGRGDDGDVMIASRVGGVTKYTMLFDHSAGTDW